MGQIARGDEKRISELVKLLETSTYEYIRIRAAEDLGQIDPGNETAISALVKLLETSTYKNTKLRIKPLPCKKPKTGCGLALPMT